MLYGWFVLIILDIFNLASLPNLNICSQGVAISKFQLRSLVRVDDESSPLDLIAEIIGLNTDP